MSDISDWSASNPVTRVIKVTLPTYLHQNLEEELQGLESSQDHIIKESIDCMSVSADSNATLESTFFR